MTPPLVCDNGIIVVESPSLIVTHPRLPAIQLHRGPRSGESFLLAVGVPLSREDLVDVGEWLIEHGRQPVP